MSEYGEPRRRGFWAAWPQAGGPLGTLLATVVAAIAGAVWQGPAFLEWGWRACFFVALPLLAVGFWIRHGIEESPVFRAAQDRAASRAAGPERSSVVEALRSPRPVLQGLGVRLGENVAFYVYTVFVVAYATRFQGLPRGDVLQVVTLGSACQFAGMILGGAWSDRVGRRRAMLVPAIGLCVWAPVFFWLAGQHSIALLAVGVAVGALGHGMLAGPEAAWIAELFPTSHRYAGASLVFQGSSIIAGAPAPFIGVWLADRWGAGAVVAYLVVTMAVAVLALVTTRETVGRHLGDADHRPA